MNLLKIGINSGKIRNLLGRIIRRGAENSINSIHGINPTTVNSAGERVILPRFASVEMRQARQMNRIAQTQIRTPLASSFSRANSADLKMLTDLSYEASGLRTVFYKSAKW